jgi:serine protein kinase
MTLQSNKSRFDMLAEKFPKKDFDILHETLTFSEYYDRVLKNPGLARTAHQRLFDMILAKGTGTTKLNKKTVTTYKFFSDPEIPIQGLERPLEELVNVFRSAANFLGTERRIILLHGPVGSAKSTICRLLKKELENSSKTDDGAIYSFSWKNLPADLESETCVHCPMHEDPLNLIPKSMRKDLEKDLNEIYREQYTKRFPGEKPYPIRLLGELDPQCRFFMDQLLLIEKGNLKEVLDKYVEVRRVCFSEADRVGIGTFQPKDEKNQDSTELTGDINFRKLGELGRDSDPRAFSFDGEFCVANRGMIEFIEVLKLDKAFLYDLLGAAQEKQIKPKKFAQTCIDLVIIGHTNNPEFQKLQEDKTMEAIKDRTIRIDIPYLLETSKELRILEQDYGKDKVNVHIAPHTLEVAAKWAVLTRLLNPKDNSCTLLDKARLYDGKILPGWTEDRVKELREQEQEGITQGMSVRYVQNKLANTLVSNRQYVNPFILLNEIDEGLGNCPLINDENERGVYRNAVTLVKNDLNNTLRKEVQEAISMEGNTMEQLCQRYMQNVVAHNEGTKIFNEFTGQEEHADEAFMRAIEEKIGIPDRNSVEFRKTISAWAFGLSQKGKAFEWDSHPKLKEAFEKYAFEIGRDTINIAKLNHGGQVVGRDQQEKIDIVRQRLIERFGYNEQSATDVMQHVSGLFAKGDLADE